MIRLVVYLLALAALATGIAWLADRPGEVMIVWQDWRIETSVMVAAAAVLAAMALAILLWASLRLLLRSPDIVALALRNRRRSKGWSAVSRGLVAVGSGDLTAARRAAADAQRLIGSEPLARLLAAQSAQLAGDASGAERAFRTMADSPGTRLLGLRGLHVEARRRGDAGAALAAAEEAARFEPGLAWAADAVIEARCVGGDFAGARAMLEREAAHGGLDRAAHRRRRAVLLAAEAQILESLDAPVARERAVEAARLAPTLVPAAEIAGRLLGANGEIRRAGKVLETAYAANPHPDLADAYLHLRPGDSSRERLKRMRTLVARAPSHPESAMTLARAALDAQDFATARTSLAPLTAAPTQRVCLLMAELEATESSDVGKAREWTARAVRAQRDPAWIADGVNADRWGPISPVTGRIDAYTWSVPPGVAATPVLENEAERVRVAIAAAIESRAQEPAPAPAPVPEPSQQAPAVEDLPRDMPNPAAAATPAPKRAEPVVATPHLPDDPGPGTSPEDAPAPRPATPFGV